MTSRLSDKKDRVQKVILLFNGERPRRAEREGHRLPIEILCEGKEAKALCVGADRKETRQEHDVKLPRPHNPRTPYAYPPIHQLTGEQIAGQDKEYIHGRNPGQAAEIMRGDDGECGCAANAAQPATSLVARGSPICLHSQRFDGLMNRFDPMNKGVPENSVKPPYHGI